MLLKNKRWEHPYETYSAVVAADHEVGQIYGHDDHEKEQDGALDLADHKDYKKHKQQQDKKQIKDCYCKRPSKPKCELKL